MAGLRTDVELGYEDALASVDRIGSGLDDVVSRFSESLASALDTASSTTIAPQVDTSALEEGLQAALATATDVVVPVEADTSAAESDIADLEAGVASEQLSLPLDVDVGPAESEVGGLVSFVDGEHAAISVDADTSEAETAVDDLTTSTEQLGTASSNAAGGVHEGADATALLAGAAGIAKGEVGGLGEIAQGTGGHAAAAAGGVAALAGATFEFFRHGVDAVSAGERFNTIVGDMAGKVENVHVGDLSATISDLGIKFGSTDREMQNATASVFQFGVNGGFSRERAATFSNELVGLAARAISLNPNLGSLSDVTESLSTRISRGGRFAASYGLALTAAEINARAMGETGKTSAASLTVQEKAFAAAEIAAGRYGDGLSTTVANGAENAANQQKSLFARIREVIEKLGEPVVVPMFDVLAAAIPVVEQVGIPLANLATAILPALSAVLGVLAPLIQPIVYGFIAFYTASTVLPAVLGLVSSSLFVVADAAPVAGAGMVAMGAEVATASETIEASAGPIGLLVAGLGIAAGALGLFSSGTDTSSASVTQFSKALEDANGKLDDTATKAARSILEERHQLDDLAAGGVHLDDVLAATNSTTKRTDDELRSVAAAAQLSGGATKNMVDAIAQSDPVLGRLLEQLLREGQLNPGLIATISELSSKHREATATLAARSGAGATDAQVTQTQASAQDALTSALANYVHGTGDAATVTQALDSAASDLKTTMDLLLGSFVSQDQARITYQEGLRKLNEQLFATGGSLDANTQAGLDNQKALDGQAASAESWSSAISKAGGSVAAASQPLEQFRGDLQTIHDSLSAAGQDTSFVDGLIGHVDQAIAGVRAKAPDAQAAGSDLSAAGAAGVTSGTPEWLRAGSDNADAAGRGVRAKKPDHQAAGADLSASGATGAGSLGGSWLGAGVASAGAHVAGVSSKNPDARSAGAGLAAAGADGASGGGFFGAGQSAGSGFAAGMRSVLSDVAAAAAQVAETAVAAVHNFIQNPPFPSAVTRELGVSFGAGLAAGIEDSTPYAAAAAAAMASGAVVAGTPRQPAKTWTPSVALDPRTPPSGAAPAGTSSAGAGASPGGHQIVVHNHLHVKADKDTPRHVVKEQAETMGETVGAATVAAVIGAL